MGSFKDPFGAAQSNKDPFDTSQKKKNPFDTKADGKDDQPFKSSGLSLGLKDLGSNRAQTNMNHLNVFKTGMPSPMGAFFGNGMDSGRDASRNAYFQQQMYARGGYPMMSPSAAITSARGAKFQRREVEQSPRVEMMPNVFQTPTSRAMMNQRLGDMSGRKDETGSFGASPKDISTTKAVFNQQTKFNQPRDRPDVPGMQKQGSDIITPSGNMFFSNSPYGQVAANYQNAFVSNYQNTPTGGSFGASPAAWYFNMPSPHTGAAANQMTPFNQHAAFAEQKEGSVKSHHSPKFNTQVNHVAPHMAQRMVKQASNQQNYAMSPVNAFSFSMKSGKHPIAPPSLRKIIRESFAI